MIGYKLSPKDLKLVVGPDIRPLPTGYWISANHTKENRNPLGFAVTQGKIFGAPSPGNPVFVVWADGKPGILDTFQIADGGSVRLALEGTARLLRNGSLEPGIASVALMPRSGIGIMDDKVIHFYSQSSSLRGFALAMKALGCRDAMQTSYTDRTAVWEKDKILAGSLPVVSLLGADTYERIPHPVVLWDPGHGGADPGALSGGLLSNTEQFYNLRYGIYAATHLAQTYGATSLLTRWTDESLSLEDRVEMANALRADVFVSCHNNAAGGKGFESFRDIDPDIPALLVEEARLQAKVHEAIGDKVLSKYGERDRGLKQADFYVLRNTLMPAVLLEGAFMDHPEDAKLLATPAYLRDLGVAAAVGVAAYLGLTPKAEQPPEIPRTGYVVEIEAENLEDAEAIRRVLSQQYTVRIVQK